MASASTTARVSGRLVSSALIAGLGAGLLCSAVAAVIDQTRGLSSALGAAVLVVVYFVSGQLIERVAMQMANSQGMMLIMSGYIGRVALLGVVLWWALSTPLLSAVISPVWVAAGALAALVGWLGGLIFRHSRARIAVYDQPYAAPKGWDE